MAQSLPPLSPQQFTPDRSLLAELFAPTSPLGQAEIHPSSPSPSQRASIELHLVCISLVFIASVCFCALLVFLEHALKPLVFAGFLAYLLSPAVELLTTPWSPRALAHRLLGALSPSAPEQPGGRYAGGSCGFDDDEPDDDESDDERALVPPRSAAAASRARRACTALPHTVACPHALAVVVVLALTSVLLVVVLNLFVTSAAALEVKWPKYRAEAVRLVGLARGLIGRDTAVSKALKSVQSSLLGASAAGGGQVDLAAVPAAWLLRWLHELPITSVLMALASGLVGALETTAVVLLFAVFLMMGRGASPRAAERPPRRAAGGAPTARATLGEKIDSQVRRYITLKSTLSLLLAVLVGLALALLRVDLAFFFATITFFANFVPNVGAVVATLLPLPVVLLDPDQSWASASLALVGPFGLHLLVGSVLEPKVLGMGLALHPVVVLFTVLLWALLWGVGGMIVSVPLTAVLRIALAEVHHPYAWLIVRILEGSWMPSSAPGASSSRVRPLGAALSTSSTQRCGDCGRPGNATQIQAAPV